MGKLRKIQVGNPRAKIGAQTFNELVEGEQSRRRELSTIEDTRSPQAKSPVVVRLVWTGETLLAPGSVVKLTKSAVDPSDESAPFSGLTFHCEAFADGDQGSPYAVSMGPIAAAVTAAGTLTTRSDDDTGVLTMDDGMHGISTGDVVDVQWAGGSRLAITVGTVAGTTVPIDGGRGDVLPDESTAVTVIRSADVGFGVMPQAYWAKVNLSSATHTTARRPASGTTLDSAVSAELGILWKPDGTGEKWCVVEIGSDHFQLVRGLSVSTVTPSDPTFSIESVVALGQHSIKPADPLTVANIPGLTLTAGQRVYAIWRKESAASVDWEAIELGTGGGSDPPLRAFELTANKTLASATATAKWLDHAGNLVGTDVTLHDPEHRFSGRIANNLYSGSAGFRGFALLRTDLADVDPDRWEIVEMDSLYEFIKAEIVKISNYPSPGSTLVVRYVEEINTAGYDRHPPAAAASEVGYAGDSDIFNVDVIDEPPSSEESTPVPVLMQLVNPDASPPTYRVYEVKSEQNAFRVRGTVVDPGGGFVSTAAPTFQITGLSKVFGVGPLPSAPLTVSQIYAQGYVAGQLTEAILNQETGLWNNLPLPRKVTCHLDEDANGFMYVTASTLAGTGLTTEAGVGGCLRLATIASANYAEGYCIDLEDLATDKIHLDQITSAAGVQATGIDTTKFQFWVHAGDATVRTDAKWTTATGYSSSATQMLGHINGVWHCKTVEEWLKLMVTWSAGVPQFLVHRASEDPKWLSPEEALKLLGSWAAGSNQSIGHDAGADPAWQNDTTFVCP